MFSMRLCVRVAEPMGSNTGAEWLFWSPQTMKTTSQGFYKIPSAKGPFVYNRQVPGRRIYLITWQDCPSDSDNEEEPKRRVESWAHFLFSEDSLVVFLYWSTTVWHLQLWTLSIWRMLPWQKSELTIMLLAILCHVRSRNAGAVQMHPKKGCMGASAATSCMYAPTTSKDGFHLTFVWCILSFQWVAIFCHSVCVKPFNTCN